ncbi:aspartyl protease family protein [Desulfurispirillum indicum]|uniref:retropepsin-like aspartic protease n=1 Tax=Desulfurispirillum indicum TaxID=936456 RepID=UPI001CFAC4C4|nr:aspartyl protease family protein [Desulfurispirillum indicum]UCZ56377.1 aspartyl protease family protein [Desulfurispirillum indicum]
MKLHKIILLGLIFYANELLANQAPPSWISEGPYLEDSPASFEVPIEVWATKLYVEIEIGNKPRRFVIDTGSPSMIDSALVEELGLKVVDTNKGRDAHGVVVETKIVQANIQIGDTSFLNVPMMAANFSASVATKAFVGDGVLGSELLSLGAWQLDLKDSVLRFNTKLQSLPHIKESKKLKMYQFGYPYTPIFDVIFARNARSKAMLDTGSPTFFSISSPDLSGTKKANGIGKTLYGYGSAGRSLGGQSPDTELLQVELINLAIDKIKLGRVVAVSRDLSPSLIGAKILERYIVTLDSRSESAYFREYADGLFAESSFGFSLAFNNNISIGAVWENSPAKAAGLQSGAELISINGAEVELTKDGLLRAAKAMEGQEIELVWKGGAAKLTRKYLIPVE